MKSKDSSRWPPSPRHPGQWPFSDDVTTRICRHAGREASAMLRVALHKNRSDGLDANAALQAVYYEPFTYWDWHGVDADDESALKYKKQLIWERQRGFTAASGEEYGYPTPKDAWLRFRTLIDNNAERTHWVKKIAVAYWMFVEDMSWIFRSLPSLEALDLSDIARLAVKPNKGYAKEPPETMTDTWALFFNRMREKCPAKDVALQLKWLGLPDFRDASLVAPRILINKFLPICTNLKTLSIRGEYREEIPPLSLSGHEYICEFIRVIRAGTPSSVTALELRLSFPLLRELLVALHAEDRLNINQIGLDLGAWVQVYPLRITSKELQDGDVVSAASKAVRKARFDIYEEEHNQVLSTSSKWLLPAPEEETSDMSDVSGSYNIPTFEKLDARPAFQYEPQNARGGRNIREYKYDRSKLLSWKKCFNADRKHHDNLLKDLKNAHVNTLPTMLVKLYDAGRIAASQNQNLYSLQPEWQANSTTPLHPLTLIQKRPFSPSGTKPIQRGEDYEEPLPDRLSEAYAWLNTTFAWRPVFDWDYFVRSNVENLNGSLDAGFKGIQQQHKSKDTNKSNNEVLITEVAKQFQVMRDAGIPIDVLLGRRNSDESSLYWGWPYNLDAWEQSLKIPFDAGLAPIAAHIDTLSIFYDLRNPLDERRLEEIDRQPYHRPQAYCPRSEDPWRRTKNSPFKKQWQDRPSRISKPNTQKWANKKLIGKKSHVPLASNLVSCLPTGEYADEHAYDDPDNDKSLPETLHQVARRAAFEREAIGWHRFWTEYASQMTNLKELRVRMPQSFDRVGSWSLYELLSPKKTWRMSAYADERAHMQTREDLLHHVTDDPKLHKHAVQEKIWPAGRFVRRTWISWTPEPTNTAEVVALQRGTDEAKSPTHPSVDNGSIPQPKTLKLERDKRDKEQLEKAVKQARETARKEQELEASLPLTEPERPVSRAPETTSKSEDIERRLTGKYGRHIRAIAQRTWRAEMRGHIEQLQDGEPTRDEAIYNARSAENEAVATEAEIARNLLQKTRERLQERMEDFRPEEVFAPCHHMDRTNGLELVKHTTNYAAEEIKRRAGPVEENVDQTAKSTSKLSSTNPTNGALPSCPQQTHVDPIEINSEESSPEESESNEDDSPRTRFAPAVSTHHVTSVQQTVTTQQGSQTVRTTQTSQTTQTQQQAPTVRQLEAAKQRAETLAEEMARKIAMEKKEAEDRIAKEMIAKEEAANKKAVEERVAREKAAKEKAAKEDAASKKAVEEKVAKDKAAKENAARKEAEQKAHEAKAIEVQKVADEAAEAAKKAAIKAQEVAATIKAANPKATSNIIPTIEKTPPAKPTKKPTKSPKTPKGKTPKGQKRKSPSPDSSDDDTAAKPPPNKKPRPSKEPPATSTPVRRSHRLRTTTPTTKVELPSDVSATSSSEDDSDDDDKPKGRKKGNKEPGGAGDYEPPGSTRKKTPTRGATAARGKGKATGKGGKAVGVAKGKGKVKGRKRAVDDEEVVEKEPVKKKPRKGKKVDGNDG